MDISPTVLATISLVISLIALFVSVGTLWVMYRPLKRQKEPEQVQVEVQDSEQIEEELPELPYLLRVGIAEQRSSPEDNDDSSSNGLSIVAQMEERYANAVYLINKDNVPAPSPVHLSIAVYTPSRYSFEPDANALTDLGTKTGKSLHGKALRVGEYILKTTEHMTLIGYIAQDTSILLPEVSETVGYFMKCSGIEFVKDRLKIPKPE